MNSDLIQLLGDGATLVTPTRRLARDLKRRFDATQIAVGRTTWPSADILPYGSWLERSFAELAQFDAPDQILGPAQALAVWQRIVAETPGASQLLDAAATARIVRDAWDIQQSWRLDLAAWRGGVPEDAGVYLRWAGHFRDRCASRNWLDTACLADAVAERLRLNPGRAPKVLVLYGFDQLTRQLLDLTEACRSAGTRVEQRHPIGSPGNAMRRAYVTAEDELLDVARRVQGLLRNDPQLRIGVVVPDLAGRRAEVMRVFDDVLEPARVLAGARTGPRPYNVSLGLPLSHYPLVYAALLILRLAQGQLPLSELGALLRSPFLAAAEQEFCRRAQLDARLRRRGRVVVDLATLYREAHAARHDDPAACRALSTRLDAWRGQAQETRRQRQLPSAWSSGLLSLLTGLGWPGERTLDSEDYQTFAKWRELVLGLSRLDPVLGPVDYDEALLWLVRLSADTLFQPEADTVAVQVLGVLEAAGIEFDHLFVTGLTDERWPAVAHPNPLLPAGLQRAHQVPHASAEWELGFARRMTGWWVGAAPEVVLSYPSRDGDRLLRASPLLAELPEAPDGPLLAADWGSQSTYASVIQASAQQDSFVDVSGPALVVPFEVPGGTAVFRNQAACPFRAFAIHRLGAHPLEEGRVGLSAAERGTMLHEAARHLWGELQSQARLLALTQAQERAAVGRAVETAIETMRSRRPDALSEPGAELERLRLRPVLGQLLAIERQRAPFRVVERERGQLQDIAGIKVEARPDRVDELDDGAHVILDYKTGAASPTAWLGARPDEPQLPLYAVEHDSAVSAVSFVLLRPGEVSFKGVASEDELLPGVSAVERWSRTRECGGWAGLLEQWRAVRDALAREFLSGHAPVAPKSYPRTCEHCALGAVCRISEVLGAVAYGDEEDEADA
jgi:probable DNA repair protein